MISFFLIFPLGMKDDKKHAINYMDQVVIGLLLAHACGRIGCFTAGCCYGLETDSIFGVYHYTRHAYYLPTQLYEAGFLILMFFILFLIICYHETVRFRLFKRFIFRPLTGQISHFWSN